MLLIAQLTSLYNHIFYALSYHNNSIFWKFLIQFWICIFECEKNWFFKHIISIKDLKIDSKKFKTKLSIDLLRCIDEVDQVEAIFSYAEMFIEIKKKLKKNQNKQLI